ncbi:MAG: hypothetical protein WC365_06780 [Candidatus Babeliales bacterium]|jgi:hypothetical protein
MINPLKWLCYKIAEQIWLYGYKHNNFDMMLDSALAMITYFPYKTESVDDQS